MARSNASFTRQVAYTKAVTPSDTTDLADGVCYGLLVAYDGNIKLTYANGLTDTIFLVSGIVHPIQAKRVWATGTTATGIKACY